MIIAVDFDGTCVTHDYPDVGKEIGAAPVLKRLTDAGHKIILWTTRSNNDAYKFDLVAALYWFEDHDIPLYGINRNPKQDWSTSPKAYAQIYIDDAALGCPLKYDIRLSDRPFVDWKQVEKKLQRIFGGLTPIGHTALVGAKEDENENC